MDRIHGLVRIRDVTLDTTHRQRPRKCPAPAVFDHVTQALGRRGFADDAIVEGLAVGFQPIDDAHRAVGGGPFFIGRDEKRDRAGMRGVLRDETLDGNDECRERRFHVGGTTTVEEPVTEGRDEGVGRPGVERPAGDDVGMPGEAHRRPRAAAARPEVGHPVRHQRLAAESRARKSRLEDLLTPGVVGRLRSARDQLARKVERWRGNHRRR